MGEVERANELYQQGFDAFRRGDNAACERLTKASLDIGRRLGDEAVIGQALTGLCRAALRNHDTATLNSLSTELSLLAERSGDAWWRVIVAHMNAELARMEGQLERADALYDESMQLSEGLGRERMVAVECFNRSFIAIAQHEFDRARELLRRHFDIDAAMNDGEADPYGLIAVAALLSAEDRAEEAAEVALVCRRLLAERDVVPDPADEAPLLAVEKRSAEQLSSAQLDQLRQASAGLSCHQVVERVLG